MKDAIGQQLQVYDIVLYSENIGSDLIKAKIYEILPFRVRLETEFKGSILTCVTRTPENVIKLVGEGINYR